MPPSASSSFIPKRNPGTKPRQTRTRNVFVLSIISYALFVSAPLASAGVFIYKLQAEKNSNSAIKELDEAIATFNDGDFKRVIAYEQRLNQAEYLVENNVSMASLIRILSNSTLKTIQFTNLEISRETSDTVVVKAKLLTSALDGVLFQREQYKLAPEISDTVFNELILTSVTSDEKDSSKISQTSKEVALTAEFKFLADEIRYTPLSISNQVTEEATVDNFDSATTTSESNETFI